MDHNEFEKIVIEGIKAIPEKFLEKLDNVDIVIEDNPTKEQLKELKVRNNNHLLGLYEGVPKTERWNYAQVLPDKITIFNVPIERIAKSREEIKEIVKETVWHEIAHHFGMSEEQVKKSEIRKINNK
ncbi:MAG: metallopeptidase family protein [Candidatus Pacebacteria bacterium]|nr:metallopeptidase family protein [Candidatus Paceibacterota bacterium]MDD2757419.1 metallopeptidase family protein [Candidatus Paceibacterota bacterium]MDD3283796.1 metallopeptidase family protein [Candidatus Paceibacterota bacterium]MDD3970002.1 metallopeptidase family protein [Candidatus Paceibacterota bacterium]MDD4738068.1 metallopeptidase family protein [Candidatus Paceibacterota bacterium]